jgi:hypothetical protein
MNGTDEMANFAERTEPMRLTVFSLVMSNVKTLGIFLCRLVVIAFWCLYFVAGGLVNAIATLWRNSRTYKWGDLLDDVKA